MNYKMIGRFLAMVLAIEALFMLPGLLLCLADGEPSAAGAFGISIAVMLIISGILWLMGRGREHGFYAREGMVCCSAGWLALSLLGCLPFFLSGQIPNYIDALFETVSGFTTTGSSILPEVESLSRGLLYWRSFSHWLGGMGVLVFVLAFASGSGRNRGFTMHLLRAESPGPNVNKLVPRMRETAILLYGLYILLTVLNILFLLAGRMPVFDAICTAFGTAGTGGFGIKNDSIASYSPYLQNVCTVFMMLFGVNFSCYYLLATRRFKIVFQDEELRLYLGIAFGAAALIAWNVRDLYDTLGETIRHAAFQVASIMTTTGFATTDFDQWPAFSKAILLTLMIIGACAGSTGGGLKCSRALLLFKTLRRNLHQAVYPQKVEAVQVNRQTISEKVLANASAYLSAYLIIILISFLIISLDGFSVITNWSAVLACFNNIGPGLDAVGPTCNFGGYSMLSKLVLIFDMLAGRLEILPVLALCSRETWHRR